MRNLLLALCCVWTFTVCAAQTPVVSQQALLDAQRADEQILLLDVRSAEEFQHEHIPGATNISYDQLAVRWQELAEYKDTPIIVYCRSGRRAGIAEEILKQQGFNQLLHLEGDFIGWKANRLPLESFAK